LELLAVFTHDLSNPLQSITVLCELGMDPDGGDDVAAQCLTASERMRTLIHGLSGFTRGLERPSEIGLVVGRLRALLARRFERHQLQVDFDYDSLSSRPSPPELELCLMTTCLGVIATMSELRVRGSFSLSARADGERAEVSVICKTQQGAPIAPSAEHLERIRVLGGETIDVVHDGPQITFRFS
jgi:signal transduction histidine kinase